MNPADASMAVSIEEMKAFDRWAVEMGVSPLVLMENAGRAVAEEVRRMFLKGTRKRVAIFAGLGNNGGDGFVTGRYLSNWGIKTDVFIMGKKEDIKNEAKVNFNILLNLNVDYFEIDAYSVWQGVAKKILLNYGLIVDAILGTGLKKPIRGLLAEIIIAVNQSGLPVLAVDIPTGMDGNTGEILGCAVKAKKTVTMGALKKGFLNPQSRGYSGEIEIADLGIAYRKVNF